MAEVREVAFTHEDLIKILIKEAGVHDGLWSLSLSFGFGTGAVQAAPGQVAPGVIVAVQNVGIQRAVEPVPQGSLVVDAAKVNPKKGAE